MEYVFPEKVKEWFTTGTLPPGIQPDPMKYLLTLISTHIQKDTGRAPLKMEYLRKVVPSAEKYIEYLIREGIIEKTEYYKKGKEARKYWFSPEYTSSATTETCENEKLILRIRKAQKSKGNSTKYPELNKYTRSLTIEQEAIEYINKNYSGDKHIHAMGSAYRIPNGDLYYYVDDTSNRYHSNITNLNRDLRPFLRIDGQELYNVDVKSCQPYLSTLAFTNSAKLSRFTKERGFSMLLESLEPIESEDIKLYITLIKTGPFYEYFIPELQKVGIFMSRDEVKEPVYKALFGKNTTHGEIRKIFISQFPNVWERLCLLRGNYPRYSKKYKFKNYRRLAILLQTVEAFLILDKILPRFYREHPGIPAVPIHDSIMTSQPEQAAKIMHEELTEFVGFSPILKITTKDKEYIYNYKEQREGEEGPGPLYHYDVENFVNA